MIADLASLQLDPEDLQQFPLLEQRAIARIQDGARPQLVRAEEIGEDTALRAVELRDPAVRANEGLLGDVIGVPMVPEDVEGGGIHTALESTHDGALKLTSRLNSGFAKSAEEFKISFVDTNDLPRRIVRLFT